MGKKHKQIYNPYLPSYEYIPDGEPHIFDGRLYIYGSHDKFGGEDYCVNDYVCWSAPVEDLSDWRYEGVIFKKSQHPYEIGKGYLFAPDVARGKDGRYYLYYSVDGSSIMSVAVCSAPAGQYEYYGDVHDKSGHVLGSAAGDFYQFDPGIFVDDDGRIFLFSGFCPGAEVDGAGRKFVGCHMCELEDDMLTVKRGPEIVIDRHDETSPERKYFEAPSLRKFHGKYYLIYSVRIGGLHYYISDRPDGDFVYGGRIHSTSDVGLNGHTAEKPAYPNGNTHGSLIEIDGRYYIFDHRLTNNSSYSRQGVAEEVFFEVDGSIAQVEATSCGLNGAPLEGIGVYPSYIACALMDKNIYASKEEKLAGTPCITQDGEDRECGPDQYVRGIRNQCIVGYKYFCFADCKRIRLAVRGDADGILHIRTEEERADVAVIEMKPGGKNDTQWCDVSAEFPVRGKKCGLYLEFEGEGSFDLLEIEFS